MTTVVVFQCAVCGADFYPPRTTSRYCSKKCAGTALKPRQLLCPDIAALLACGEGWREQAACKGEDPNLWFPSEERNDQGAAARAICARCPVSDACLAYAVAHGEVGMWAGTSERERRRLRRTA